MYIYNYIIYIIIYIYTSNHKLYLLQPSNGQSWGRFVGFATNVNSYGGYHLSFESLSHAITIFWGGLSILSQPRQNRKIISYPTQNSSKVCV